jgi:molecular chaperone DnaJ
VAFQQGFFTIARTCGTCGGSGRRIVKPCKACRGQGRIRRERTLTVRIPPGVGDGTRLRLSGEGEASAEGGPPGDLYVMLRVKSHPVFVRDGSNLVCEATLSFAQAALGTTIRVPVVGGEPQDVDVPAGTQAGTVIRLAGKGVPGLQGGGRGDQLVVIRLRTPDRLTPEQRELFEKLASLDGDTTSERGLFDRVKDIFS